MDHWALQVIHLCYVRCKAKLGRNIQLHMTDAIMIIDYNCELTRTKEYVAQFLQSGNRIYSTVYDTTEFLDMYCRSWPVTSQTIRLYQLLVKVSLLTFLSKTYPCIQYCFYICVSFF